MHIMPIHGDALVVRPLFMDALSGGFEPLSDPQGRTHTLGRLAYASFTKGDVVMDGYDDEHFGVTYEPSWAPGVEATVICKQFSAVTYPIGAANTVQQSAQLESLRLKDAAGAEALDLHNATTLSPHTICRDGLVIIRNFREVSQTPLLLGDDLNMAQRLATEQAQDFFDKVAQ